MEGGSTMNSQFGDGSFGTSSSSMRWTGAVDFSIVYATLVVACISWVEEIEVYISYSNCSWNCSPVEYDINITYRRKMNNYSPFLATNCCSQWCLLTVKVVFNGTLTPHGLSHVYMYQMSNWGLSSSIWLYR